MRSEEKMELTDVFLTQYFEIWLCVSHSLICLNWNPLWCHFWEGVYQRMGGAWSLGWACTATSEQFQSFWKCGTKMQSLLFFSLLHTTTKKWVFCLCQGLTVDYTINLMCIFIAVWPCYVKLLHCPYTLNCWYYNQGSHALKKILFGGWAGDTERSMLGSKVYIKFSKK